MNTAGELSWLEDPVQTRRVLGWIALRVSHDVALHEDLVQEAAIHLWRRLEQHPGQRRSWYLQSCLDHLRNYVRLGRSVDSLRRRRGVDGEDLPAALAVDRSLGDEDVLPTVCAHDLIDELSKRLTPTERGTLRCLADGLSSRETALLLGISHTTINKHRRKIEVLASELNNLQEMAPVVVVRRDVKQPPGSVAFIKVENGREQKTVSVQKSVSTSVPGTLA